MVCNRRAKKKVCFWENFALVSRIIWVLVFLTLFNCLFGPTSQSPMSKLFRFSESFKKSNGRKWSQNWQLLRIKGVKLPREKKFFSSDFPPLKVQCLNFLDFRKRWGKVRERSGLIYELIKGKKSPCCFFFFLFLANVALLAGFLLVLVLLSATVERCFVSRMRDFCNQ